MGLAMGKWADALAAHLADEKLRHPPMGAPSKPSKGGYEPFEGEGVGGAEDFSVLVKQMKGEEAGKVPWRAPSKGSKAPFVARVALFMRRGLEASDADDLAERLHLRDATGDDRRLCLECRHYRPGKCVNHRRAGLASADVGHDLVALAQRCPGFVETTR